MSDKQFAEIIASAMMMVLRAINSRYGLRIWFLSREDRRALIRAMQNDGGECARVLKGCLPDE